jgi:hypothetical protein
VRSWELEEREWGVIEQEVTERTENRQQARERTPRISHFSVNHLSVIAPSLCDVGRGPLHRLLPLSPRISDLNRKLEAYATCASSRLKSGVSFQLAECNVEEILASWKLTPPM